MGICFGFLPFFDAVHETAGIRSPFLALGSQQIFESAETVATFSQAHGYTGITSRDTPAPLLRLRYGVTDYRDADINERASIHLDLTQNLTPDDALWQKFGTIYNGGTTEHIFDIAKAFRTIHNLLSCNGVCIHISPVSWLNHGFYNFTMKFYDNIIQANQYIPLVSGYYFMKPLRLEDGTEFLGFCRTLDTDTTPGSLSTAIEQQMKQGRDIPQNTLVCVAYQKTHATEFIIPYDIDI